MTGGSLESFKEGRIIKGVGGFYTVLCADGSEHTCKARGLFRKQGMTPLPGVFAAGDCLGGLCQVSVTVGTGALAGQRAADFVHRKKR